MDEFESAGVEITHGYSKRTFIPEGVTLRQHSHKYDHISVLVKGIAEVRIEGSAPVIYKAPEEIMVPAHCVHSVRSVTPVIWYCIHDMENVVAAEFDERLIE